MSEAPRLSVVVALQEGEEWSPAGLCGLVRQRGEVGEDAELVLVDGRRPGAPPLAEVDPEVRLVRAPEATSLPLLLARGIEASRGAAVALSEAHVVFAADWLRSALAAARRSDRAAVGGAVLPGRGLGTLGLALFFCDYAQFLPPLAAGPAVDLPGCNVLFQRRALARGAAGEGATAAAEEDGGFWKTWRCHELLRDGERLAADPGLVVYVHRSPGPLRWLRRRWVHGRCFGAMRAARLSAGQRLAVAFAGPLLPFILTWRLIVRVWSKRAWRLRFLPLLPLCFVAHVAWIKGEWVGNLAGAGRTCAEV